MLTDSLVSVQELMRPLEKYLENRSVTEICINRPGELFLWAYGKWDYVADPSLTYDWAYALVIAAAIAEGKRIDASTPVLSTELPGGLRMQAVIPPASRVGRILVAMKRPSVQFEDPGSFEWTLDKLEPKKFARKPSRLKWYAGDAIRDAVRAFQNIVIVGAVNTGKTALMRNLIVKSLRTDRIVTIEDVHEMAVVHPNNAQLFFGESLGVTPGECLQAALRLRPERLVFNECRGKEAFDYLRMLMTGQRGTMTTFHAESVHTAIEQFSHLARLHPDAQGLDPQLLQQIAARGIDCIIEMRIKQGARRVANVKWLHWP